LDLAQKCHVTGITPVRSNTVKEIIPGKFLMNQFLEELVFGGRDLFSQLEAYSVYR
jgi:hypothetical protein